MRAIALAGFLLTALPVPSAEAQDLAASLVRGGPWTASLGQGRSMRMTFERDGRVTTNMGFLARNLRWSLTGDLLCLTGGPGGDRCATLRPAEDGFVGEAEGEPLLRLSR